MKKNKLKKIIGMAAMGICALVMPFGLVGCDQQNDNDINVRFQDNYFQWQYEGDDEWKNLLTIDEIKEKLGAEYQGVPGVDGREVEFQTADTHIQWRYKTSDNSDTWKNLVALSEMKGEDGEDGANGTNGTNGVDGREVEFRTTDTYIQWRYVDATQGEEENWTNLVELELLKGDDGENGTNGAQGAPGEDGREIEIQTDENTVSWRYEGETEWQVLIDLTTLNGLDGAKGEDGLTPRIGDNGNWWIGDTDTGVKAEGVDATYETYTITYDYDYTGMEDCYDNYKSANSIKSTQWLVNMPMPKDNCSGEFDGWYIKDTDKKIENYDFIGGDVILQARWKTLPSGLYNDKTYTMSWETLLKDYPKAFSQDQTSIIDFPSLNGNLIIDKSITSIGENAFDSCKNLITVIIPNSVTQIGKGAFRVCTSLQSVILPDGLADISDEMFDNCYSLSNIKIPNSVKTIGKLAFYECPLTNLSIPKDVVSIGMSAFAGSAKTLINIEVENGNEVYDSRDNCNAIIESTTNTLIYGCVNTSIPNSVSKIGRFSFYNCLGIENLTIPEGVSDICEYAFFGCENLWSICIPSSVENVEEAIFGECYNLECIFVDNNNEIFDSRDNCNAIIESQSNKLIIGCKSTIIPDSIVSLGDQVFRYCDQLTSITIPNSVTSIGYRVFSNSIKEIYFNGLREEWEAVDLDESNNKIIDGDVKVFCLDDEENEIEDVEISEINKVKIYQQPSGQFYLSILIINSTSLDKYFNSEDLTLKLNENLIDIFTIKNFVSSDDYTTIGFPILEDLSAYIGDVIEVYYKNQKVCDVYVNTNL